MYYSNYEDYMRMVLGYPMENTNSTYRNDNNWYSAQNNVNSLISNPEELYPEIYRKINPAVCQMCDKNVEPLTKELLEQMTEQIYNTVEGDVNTVVNINVEAGKRVDNRGIKEPAKAEVREKRQRINNPLLRDLIRILILNRILGENRPPMPPPRPPFPGGQGRPPRMPFTNNPYVILKNFQYMQNIFAYIFFIC